ncbi:hypothetical protein HK104_005275 [Borealophlyctis nickersoniae]|nr:hypothetical protein HK104_005275 [Borealophlyctis nickersoniae]
MVPPAQDSQHLYDDTQYSPDEAAPLLSPKRDTALSMAVFKREGKVLGRMAWPVSAGYLMQNSISLAAVFSVGHLGTKELAAVALATMFCNVTGYSIGIGMGSALDTLCSQAHTGSPDPHALGKHLQRAIVVMFFLCFPIASLWFFAEPFLLLVGQEPEIADLSGKFARISILGLFPYLTNEAMKRYLQCQGIMKANMFIICIASPFNIFLQWLLVWSPIAIGVLGAPVATCITFCSLPIMTGLYIKFVEGGHAWGGWEWKEALDWPQIWTFIKLGIPGVAMTCTEWWAFEVVALAAGWLDGQSLASQSIVLNTATLTYMMPLGIAVASSTRIGHCSLRLRRSADAWSLRCFDQLFNTSPGAETMGMAVER